MPVGTVLFGTFMPVGTVLFGTFMPVERDLRHVPPFGRDHGMLRIPSPGRVLLGMFCANEDALPNIRDFVIINWELIH